VNPLNRHPNHRLFVPLAIAPFALVMLLWPGDVHAWSERYFLRGDGHGQYLSRRDTIALGAGDSMASNRAIHTIDPWPSYAKDDRLEFDGERMSLGITLYKSNKSIEPEGLETQSIVGGAN
jgi:hypothetical protein